MLLSRNKVAACVPAYNNEATIAQAVMSLRSQTVPVDDVFVVNDGSTDATLAAAAGAGARVVT
ncbi:MAG: glycosyltransferase, partial [Chlorobia bacterium]|nr:glycosyltransferase [Fimbriimonadaceae bacterium]